MLVNYKYLTDIGEFYCCKFKMAWFVGSISCIHDCKYFININEDEGYIRCKLYNKEEKMKRILNYETNN